MKYESQYEKDQRRIEILKGINGYLASRVWELEAELEFLKQSAKSEAAKKGHHNRRP